MHREEFFASSCFSFLLGGFSCLSLGARPGTPFQYAVERQEEISRLEGCLGIDPVLEIRIGPYGIGEGPDPEAGDPLFYVKPNSKERGEGGYGASEGDGERLKLIVLFLKFKIQLALQSKSSG